MLENEETECRRKIVFGLVLVLGVAIVAGGLLINYKIPSWLVENGKIGSAADFGSVFGFSSALFTGLAFIGLLYANQMQREELRIARKDLKRTKNMLLDQKKSIDEQNKTLEKKSFEDTFFGSVRILVDSYNQIKCHKYEAGQQSVHWLSRQAMDHFEEAVAESGPQLAGEEAVQTFEEWTDTYMSLLKVSLQIVENSSAASEAHSDILRATVDSHMRRLIFMFGACRGDDEFVSLINKYSILRGWNVDIYGADRFLQLRLRYDANAFS